MTETQKKLRDAATQMKLALKNHRDLDVVRSCVNSFISHGRSVTFVMQKESAKHPALLQWYNAEMEILKKEPIMHFFNELRVHTIHKGVVSPEVQTTKAYNLEINGVPQPGEGVVEFLRFKEAAEHLPGDSGGVYRLCEKYFLILKGLVNLWLAKRHELRIR